MADDWKPTDTTVMPILDGPDHGVMCFGGDCEWGGSGGPYWEEYPTRRGAEQAARLHRQEHREAIAKLAALTHCPTCGAVR